MVNVHVILNFKEADVSGGDPEFFFPKMIKTLRIVLNYRTDQNNA